MKFQDLTDADIGKTYIWPDQQPQPVPFEYLGRFEGEGVEPSWLIQLKGQPRSSLLMQVWGDTCIVEASRMTYIYWPDRLSSEYYEILEWPTGNVIASGSFEACEAAARLLEVTPVVAHVRYLHELHEGTSFA